MADISSAVETAKKEVQALFDFRDHYFERFDLERATHKADDVQKQLAECLQKLESLQDEISNKAEYLMVRGRALNIQSTYSAEAEECLSKAIKLDPKLVDAWVSLGEVFWKHKDIEGAKNCFLGALNHSKDKVALRNLSMVLRQLGSTPEEKTKLIQESVDKARDSVQLDVNDGTSWFILGNAYLSMFFVSGQTGKVLKQCTGAYQQAEKDVICQNNPDLHFNRATVYRYQEDYLQALNGFSRAAMLDPTWEEPSENERQLLAYLSKVMDLVNTKGKIKGKKLSVMQESIRSSDLGPYDGGSFTNSSGASIKLSLVPFMSLKPERNPEVVVLGRVVCSINTEDLISFTFCMVDREGSCLAVTVYNLAQGYGVKIGDAVAIPEPYLQAIDFDYKGQKLTYNSIRVTSPVVLVVNGRKQGIDKQAPMTLAISAMSE